MTAAGTAAPGQRAAPTAAASLPVVVLAGFAAPAMAEAAATPGYAAAATTTLYPGSSSTRVPRGPGHGQGLGRLARPGHRRRQPHLWATAVRRPTFAAPADGDTAARRLRTGDR